MEDIYKGFQARFKSNHTTLADATNPYGRKRLDTICFTSLFYKKTALVGAKKDMLIKNIKNYLICYE